VTVPSSHCFVSCWLVVCLLNVNHRPVLCVNIWSVWKNDAQHGACATQCGISMLKGVILRMSLRLRRHNSVYHHLGDHYAGVAIGKARAACAQSFELWQQATIEFTCHDHSIVACSRQVDILLFLAHIPFVVNQTCNATLRFPVLQPLPERLQHREWVKKVGKQVFKTDFHIPDLPQHFWNNFFHPFCNFLLNSHWNLAWMERLLLFDKSRWNVSNTH